MREASCVRTSSKSGSWLNIWSTFPSFGLTSRWGTQERRAAQGLRGDVGGLGTEWRRPGDGMTAVAGRGYEASDEEERTCEPVTLSFSE